MTWHQHDWTHPTLTTAWQTNISTWNGLRTKPHRTGARSAPKGSQLAVRNNDLPSTEIIYVFWYMNICNTPTFSPCIIVSVKKNEENKSYSSPKVWQENPGSLVRDQHLSRIPTSLQRELQTFQGLCLGITLLPRSTISWQAFTGQAS